MTSGRDTIEVSQMQVAHSCGATLIHSNLVVLTVGFAARKFVGLEDVTYHI